MDAFKLALLSLLPLLLFHVKTAASSDTIYVNGSIRDGNFVISKGGNFALGFFSPGRSRYRYLGIWYHDKPGQTVVWVANRNSPINGTSGILSSDGHGNLVLYSGRDREVPAWSTNVTREWLNVQCYAQLLDSGNLVVFQGAKDRTMVWQSFDHPTDTLLPGMKIGLSLETGLNFFLTSWRSGDDPGTGDFSFKLNPNGSPQFFLYRGTDIHWRCAPWPWDKLPVPYNHSFIYDEVGIYFSFRPHDASTILMFVVHDSGTFRVMTWEEDAGRWKDFYVIMPQKCDRYGHCGAYGRCDPSSTFLSECGCLPGYEPKSQRKESLEDGSTGCVRKRLESSSVCGHGEGFVSIQNVKLPDTSTAVWVDMGLNKVNCEHECRKNCSCSAYTTPNIVGKGTGCLTWHVLKYVT